MPASYVTASDLLAHAQELATLGAASPSEAVSLRLSSLESILGRILQHFPPAMWIELSGLQGVAVRIEGGGNPPDITPE